MLWTVKDVAAAAAADDAADDDEDDDNDDDVRGNTMYITDQYRNNLPILTRYFRDASPALHINTQNRGQILTGKYYVAIVGWVTLLIDEQLGK